jgi:hypothetical protein
MITDNKYIDIAHTISLNCVFPDGRKNYIKAMLEFAEAYHEMELKKLRVADVSGRSEQLKAFAKHYNEQHYEEISEEFIDEYLKSL